MSWKSVVYAVIWIAIASVTGHESFASEEQAVIIGLKRPEGLFAQGLGKALEAKIAKSGGRVEYAYKLIDAVAARLTGEALRELASDPNVRYIAADAVVYTPERLTGSPVPHTAAAELSAMATPVELYSWGIERIRAPAVHRADYSRALFASGASVGLLLALGIVAVSAISLRNRRFQKLGLLTAMAFMGVGILGGCTSVIVLPHAGILGEGIEVALLDTGVDLRHPDLRDNIVGGIDFVNHDDEPQDDNGHGTGVAGILAATENGLGLVGVAPKVGIWAVKMLGHDEQGSISDLIRGIEWALDRGVEIINMSLGTPEDNPALREAIIAAYQAGVLLVAAAGNKGSQVLFPAAYPEVIAVAASDKNDQHAWFSNMGPEVELTAPGTDLLSTGLTGQYQIVNGTSFSVPHVSGVAALLFSIGITDARQVRQRLDQTAEDLGLTLTAQGYGLVDAKRAVLGEP